MDGPLDGRERQVLGRKPDGPSRQWGVSRSSAAGNNGHCQPLGQGLGNGAASPRHSIPSALTAFWPSFRIVPLTVAHGPSPLVSTAAAHDAHGSLCLAAFLMSLPLLTPRDDVEARGREGGMRASVRELKSENGSGFITRMCVNHHRQGWMLKVLTGTSRRLT